MKKVLITGNSGYIGSHLTKLLENDYELYGVDLVPPKVPIQNFVLQDIRYNFNNIYDFKFDAVIHLAALVNVGQSEVIPSIYYLTNVFGTLSLLNHVVTDNLIFASTGAAEGCGSAYGISKRAAEDIVKEHAQRENFNYTSFRFYNVLGSEIVGPTNQDGLMYNLIKAKDTGEFTIHGTDYIESWDGTCVRDYVHVNEICEALKDSIETPANGIECLGHGVGYTVKEIVDIFQRVNQVDFKINYGQRRKGDLPSSVLEKVSPYMKNLYSIEELLKLSI